MSGIIRTRHIPPAIKPRSPLHIVKDECETSEEQTVWTERFKQRIQTLFQERYSTPKQFFKYSGFEPRQWYRLFQKDANPTFRMICELAKALDVHPRELFNFDKDEN